MKQRNHFAGPLARISAGRRLPRPFRCAVRPIEAANLEAAKVLNSNREARIFSAGGLLFAPFHAGEGGRVQNRVRSVTDLLLRACQPAPKERLPLPAGIPSLAFASYWTDRTFTFVGGVGVPEEEDAPPN